MRIAILGAGVIGVTTAYYLQKAGHEVVVIDRNEESSRECSFSNGAQLSYSHAEPWASPASLKKGMKWMFMDNAPMKLHFRADFSMWRWLAKFASNCRQEKVEETTKKHLELAMYCRKLMHDIIDDVELDCHYSKSGILHVFWSQKTMDDFAKQCEFQRRVCNQPFERFDVEQCLSHEPSLLPHSQHIAGGIYFPMDECADIFPFTQQLAKHTADKGVEYLYNTKILSLDYHYQTITGAITDKGRIEADAYINCLGSYSPLLMKDLGVYVPIFPMKGYSISVPIDEPKIGAYAPNYSITDHRHKVVFTRIGNVLRMAGTAEFAGYDDSVTEKRIEMLKSVMKQTFPHMDVSKATSWACLRSSTPDGPPIVGHTPFNNLYMNTGHGTLGWTQGAATSKMVADMIDGKKPELSLSGLTLDRF